MATIEDLKVVMDKYPDLTSHGFGVYTDLSKYRGQGITVSQARVIEFDKQRRELVERYGDRFPVTVRFIDKYFEPIETCNTRHSTYGLKHTIENYLGYIPSSICMAALFHLGYKCNFAKSQGAYAYFNISEKSIKSIQDKMGHTLRSVHDEIKDWEGITAYRPWLKE